jgi:chromosome segregation ATPase
MAKAIPNPEPPSNNPSGLEAWSKEDLLPKDQQSFGARPASGLKAREKAPAEQPADSTQLADLQAENTELRSIIADLQQELEAVSGKNENDWTERQKEYEGLLDEKTELIRQLHIKIQEMEEQFRELQEHAAKPPTPKEEELMAMSEELERERCQLQQERRKLDEELRVYKEDSEALNGEMRQMEVQMARERADLARQRTEVQRISEEIRHELERIERNSGLNSRLEQLRTRHQDTTKGRGG